MTNSRITSRGYEYAMQKLGVIDAQSVADIQAGKKEFKDAYVYVRKAITASASNDLEITSSGQNAVAGLTNLRNRKLESKRYFFLEKVICRLAKTTSAYNDATTTRAADYSSLLQNADGTRRIVGDIANAELVVYAGTQIIFSKLVKDIMLDGRDFVNNEDEGFNLQIPKMVKADQDIKVVLRFGEGTAAPASSTFYAIEVEMHGTDLNDKDAI